jgi:hypothetical protein
MSRSARRLAQIKSEVPIQQVLFDYGYKIHMGGQFQEQQFPCDLHGDGQDGKPSARMYPATNQWYCFACDKSRDAVETVRAKEGIEFMDAMAFIENRYGLPTVPWEDDDDTHQGDATSRSVAAILDAKSTFKDDRLKLVSLLNMVSETPNLFPVSMDMVLAQWEAVDKMTYMVAEGVIGEASARMVIAKLYERLMESLNPKDAS